MANFFYLVKNGDEIILAVMVQQNFQELLNHYTVSVFDMKYSHMMIWFQSIKHLQHYNTNMYSAVTMVM